MTQGVNHEADTRAGESALRERIEKLRMLGSNPTVYGEGYNAALDRVLGLLDSLGAVSSSPSTPDLEERAKRDGIPCHTIEQQSGTIYFRLVEDPQGAWVTFANHNAIVTKLEKRIEAAEAKLASLSGEATPSQQEHTCHDMNPPHPYPCVACETEQLNYFCPTCKQSLIRSGEATPSAATLEYLKEGETVEECLHRNRADIQAVLSLLARERQLIETLDPLLCDIAQIFNGWRTDETWSTWDESVAARLSQVRSEIAKADPVSPSLPNEK